MAVALVLAACSGGDGSDAARSTTTERQSTTASTTAAAGSSSTTAAAGSSSTTDTTPVLGLVGTASATGLSSQTSCSGTPPAPLVRLAWTPSKAGPQRVDVAVTGSGFEPGAFSSSEELGADVATLDWHDAKGEAGHHWRVLTRTARGWEPSATATFEGPGCVGVDVQGG